MTLDSGQTASLARFDGAGCLRHLWITARTEEAHCLRRLVLRAYWDGEEEASVETPLGDFCGVGHAAVSNYWSQPLNMVTGGFAERKNRAAMNCFFPMPFASQARITIENQGQHPVSHLYYYVAAERYAELPSEALRFHAQWRRQNPTPPRLTLRRDRSPQEWLQQVESLRNRDGRNNYVLLEAEGRGHYVGCTLSIDHVNPVPGNPWFGEGDDMIFIDGDSSPTLRGTGTEDYFGAAWGFPAGRNCSPYQAVSLAGPTAGSAPWSGKWSLVRLHVQDPVLFRRSIRVTIEHGHANVHANDYSSVAYWYQEEPHATHPPLPPVERRLPIDPQDSLRAYRQTC